MQMVFGSRSSVGRVAALFFALQLSGSSLASAQASAAGSLRIDSISVVTNNVFEPREAERNFLFRMANAVRFKTRPVVVRRELLFEAGETYDSARVAETSRNLRRLGIFRDVTIDTIRFGDKLVAQVATGDAWSTQIQFNARSTGGVLTGEIGVTERNFLGLANVFRASYRDEPDRTAVTLRTRINRALGTRVIVSGLYDDLSDGNVGAWSVGVPFRSFSDGEAFEVRGLVAKRRALQFRDGILDRTYERRVFRANASVAKAAGASAKGYFRIGLLGQVKHEEFILSAVRDGDELVPVPRLLVLIPDTVTAAVGVFWEWQRARFKVVTHYNGFAREEDINLSTRVRVAAWAAPSAFGYPRSGIGPLVQVSTGVVLGKLFARIGVHANGLITSAGLDSGLVSAAVTVGSQIIRRNATVLHVEAGARKNPPPGFEFDLGHGRGPRAFEPHAFTGTRSVWGTLEHRAFLIDELLGLFGVGFAAFFDYGGAWYDDQPARLGGDVGLGLRFGMTRATGSNLGRFDLAYRFGEGWSGNRVVFSFGRSYTF